MTDDKLERLRTACEGKKDITLPALEVLNMVDMIQNYGAEIDRLYKDLGDAHNELDELRKVVWHLDCEMYDGIRYWYIEDEIQYGLDIAKLQREIGK